MISVLEKNSFYSSFCWRLNLKKCWVTPLFTDLTGVAGSQYISRIDPLRYNTKSAGFWGLFGAFFPSSRKIFGSQAIYSLYFKNSARGMSLKMISEKQTSDETPSCTDLSFKTHTNLCIIQWFLTQDRTLEFL